jgi:hypothetical protein
MPDNRVRSLAPALPFRHAALQRIPWAAGMGQEQDESRRRLPAKVYPATADEQEWVVEPPSSGTPASAGVRTFSGVAALAQALEYAYRTYGSAVYLSR